MHASIKAFALAGIVAATPVFAQDMPFGSDDDAAYAQLLWDVMEAGRLAGPDKIMSFPYPGTDPHGMMLETFYTTASVNGHTGDLVVKRNYGPVGVSEAEVLENPDGHLGAYTVMFRREAGYDEDNQNWFWVKYLPDGSLDKNPMGMRLAGMVGKNADAGCIACHKGSENYLFTNTSLGMN